MTDLMSRLLCNDAHCTLKLIQIPYCPPSCVMHPESLANMMYNGYLAQCTALADVQTALGH